MTIIERMLEKYHLSDKKSRVNAIKEIIQEVFLAAVAKTSFFSVSAFYGGTALRIFHHLPRFSEDLDFSLITPDLDFSFAPFLHQIEETMVSVGLNLEFKLIDKNKQSAIKSAFMKGNTRKLFLVFFDLPGAAFQIIGDEKIQIKFEIDTDPPHHATTEIRYGLLPFPYMVRIYDKPSLLAGKIHAVLARNWVDRVKGRDLFDYLFFLESNTPVNLLHLEARLKQTNTISQDESLTISSLQALLLKRFGEIDYEKAKSDVIPFISDASLLDLWSYDFFASLSTNLKSTSS